MGSTDEILAKYSQKIESEMSNDEESYSREYLSFKEDMLPEISRYQRLVNTLNFVKVHASQKDEARLQKYLDIAHLTVTPSQAITFAALSFIASLLLVVAITASLFFIQGKVQLMFLFLGVIVSLFVFYYTYSYPKRLANAWRLKASSQMVPAVLYVVVYMKHTSNLEKAIEFAAQRLEIPLALDFRKIFWDVEVGRFSTLKQSLDVYLESWRDYAPEFVESFHLIESSLYEPSESRRVQTLEKALQIILDGVYEKMLKYSREIRSPLTNIYMLGIILPTLGLALLPLLSTLMGGVVQWQHIFLLFNVIVPFMVFYMTSEVLLKRPGGYGESSVLEKNPDYPKFISRKPWFTAFLICFPLLILGLLPFIFQTSLISTLGFKSDYTFQELHVPFLSDSGMKIFDFKQVNGATSGPFGAGAALLSLCVPLSIGLFFSLVYKKKTKELIKSREKTKELEREFNNSLFQLGNRLGDGMPAEIALIRVAAATQGQKTQSFFAIANENIQQLGMSVEQAIFNPKRGAIIYFPSALIATSMRILVESVKKGLEVAARSLMSISEYVKNIQKIDDRLRDLLAEVVSDMKSNMTFLAPLLAGIVVGLSAMITMILNTLQLTSELGGQQALGGFASISSITALFDVRTMIPPYFIQVSIGLYIVEIIFILTAALVTVDAGKDPLREKYELARNLKRGLVLYISTALLSIVALTLLAAIVLPGIGTPA